MRRVIVAALTGLAMLGLAWVEPPAMAATAAGANGRIIFAGDGVGLTTIKSDGSGATGLPITGHDPVWSPDGTKIAYVKGYLYMSNADGSGVTQLSTSDSVCDPTWSPDGRYVAASGCGGGVFVVNVSTLDITDLPTSGRDPDWSPDGTRILVFEAQHLYTIAPDGTDLQQLTTVPFSYNDPAWSPDGTKIAVGPNQIYVLNADGTGLTELTLHGQTPAWSPDGTRIAFISKFGVEASFELYTMKADGTDLQRLTFNLVTEFEPNWQPLPLAPGCTISGSAAGETLVGTAGKDVICGGGGGDTLKGLGGNDTFYGGAGADSILGAAGADSLHGEAGNDKLSGGPGRDTCIGAGGTDQLSGCERMKAARSGRRGLEGHVEARRVPA